MRVLSLQSDDRCKLFAYMWTNCASNSSSSNDNCEEGLVDLIISRYHNPKVSWWRVMKCYVQQGMHFVVVILSDPKRSYRLWGFCSNAWCWFGINYGLSIAVRFWRVYGGNLGRCVICCQLYMVTTVTFWNQITTLCLCGGLCKSAWQGTKGSEVQNSFHHGKDSETRADRYLVLVATNQTWLFKRGDLITRWCVVCKAEASNLHDSVRVRHLQRDGNPACCVLNFWWSSDSV